MPSVEGGLRLTKAIKNGTSRKPLVSIITPTLNIIDNKRERYFRQLMHTINAQKYGRDNIEHIIVDGGSLDGTLELIKEYDSKGDIDYWVSEPDSGIYNAMNKGVELSKGLIINFSSSDDYFSLDAVDTSVRAIIKNNADYSHGLTPYLLENNNIWYVAGHKYSWNQIFFGMPIGHQSLFIKKDSFNKIGPFSEDHIALSDFLFTQQLYLNNLTGISIEQVTAYFRHFGGKSSSEKYIFTEFAEHYKQTSKSLNLEYEQFLFFLYHCNQYIGKAIITATPSIEHLSPALENLFFCNDRATVTRFQKALIFCLFKNNHFDRNHFKGRIASENKREILELLNELHSSNIISNNEHTLISRMPFIVKSEEIYPTLDSALEKISRQTMSTSAFRLQQILIKTFYKIIYSTYYNNTIQPRSRGTTNNDLKSFKNRKETWYEN